MKRIIVSCIASLILITLISTGFAEEENDILKRRKKWLDRVLAAETYEKQVSAPTALKLKEKKDYANRIILPGKHGLVKPRDPERVAWVKAATKDLAQRLDIPIEKIEFLGLNCFISKGGGPFGDYLPQGTPRTWDYWEGEQIIFQVGEKLYAYRGLGNLGDAWFKQILYIRGYNGYMELNRGTKGTLTSEPDEFLDVPNKWTCEGNKLLVEVEYKEPQTIQASYLCVYEDGRIDYEVKYKQPTPIEAEIERRYENGIIVAVRGVPIDSLMEQNGVEEVLQRKSIERKNQSNKNHPFFYPQMADKPQHASIFPLQPKNE